MSTFALAFSLLALPLFYNQSLHIDLSMHGLTLGTGAASTEVKSITAVAKEVFIVNSLISGAFWEVGLELLV